MKMAPWLWVAALAGAACGDNNAASEPQLGVEGLGVEGLGLGEVEVGTNGASAITLRNTGSAATGGLAITLNTIGDVGGFTLEEASTCIGARLAPGAACTVAVRFAPLATGLARAALRIYDPSTDHTLEVALTASARPRRGVTVTFTGAGKGAVRVTVAGQTTVCRATCTVAAASGAQVRLRADTPSRFGSFTGACAATAPDCTFTAAPSSDVTVRFDADTRERLTLLFPGAQVLSVDYDSSGNLVIGTASYVTKVNRSGTEVWKRPLAGEARVGAGDVVFVRSGATLTKLSAAGATLWSVAAVTGGCAAEPNRMARTWAAMPDGGVAIQGASALVAYNSDGSTRFSKSPIGPACRGPLAVGSDNRVYTGIENLNAEPTDLLVFEGNGTAAPTIENAAPQYHLALAARNGRVAIASSGHSYVSLRTLTATAADTDVADADFIDHGVAIDDDGDVVSALVANEATSTFATGAIIRRYAPTMQLRWSLTKAVLDDQLALETIGVTPLDLTIDDGSRDLAIGGRYFSPTFDGGWVEIFAEP